MKGFVRGWEDENVHGNAGCEVRYVELFSCSIGRWHWCLPQIFDWAYSAQRTVRVPCKNSGDKSGRLFRNRTDCSSGCKEYIAFTEYHLGVRKNKSKVLKAV